MKLKEFPYFANDVINITSEENISRLRVNQSVQLFEYDDHWLLQQSEERVSVSCSKIDRPHLTSLTRRAQTRWMLANLNLQNNTLQLQYMAPVEINLLDLTLGVDGLISDDLFTKNEISENSIEAACQWLAEHFILSTTNTSDLANRDISEEHWLPEPPFSIHSVSQRK